MPIKLVKKSCGIHWGRTAGPCAKCAAQQKSYPPSSLVSGAESDKRIKPPWIDSGQKCSEPNCTEKPFFAVTQKQGNRKFQPKTRYWCCTHAPSWVDRGYTSKHFDVKRIDQ